jgi:glutaredoxin 3
MSKVEIYTQAFCGYCHRAKKLLDDKGVTYDEIDVMMEPARKREMIDRAGGRSTTPQIFIDGKGIGGSDELSALNRSGELDRLLAAAPGA